ncbi:MAG: hypothetical protein ABFE07_28720 [Armatimonadia bacterium]
MTGQDFFKAVEAHPDLEGLDVATENGEDVAYVLYKPTSTKYRVTFTAISEEPWSTLEAILTGKRDARVLDHMTRVIGYFSRVANWNKSKVGELHDRHKGHYGVGGAEQL